MISLRLIRTNRLVRPIYKTSQRSFATPQTLEKKTEVNSQQDEWQFAKPFKSLPRPSKYELVRSYFPGGRFYGKSLNEIFQQMRKDHGDIFLFPGLFGKNDCIFTYNPEDFEKVFRTEGVYPLRRGFGIMRQYRKVERPEIFKETAGLAAEHGVEWSSIRSAVNPVLMNPKTFKLYTPKLDELANQFITRIKEIRDPQTSEVPENFREEFDFLAMETVGVVALDTHLGLIDGSVANKNVKKFISSVRDFFELILELEMKPSLWKLVATPKYKKFVAAMDVITEVSIHYVEEAEERLKINEAKGITKPEWEKSILERLIKTSPAVAKVVAMETILAGVDAVTAVFASCLLSLSKNPVKQKKLREEILGILPEKDTPLTADKMNHLPYLRACIKESLRLNPIIITNFRTTGQDIVLSGYRIPKGEDVVMPNQDLLLDEKYYARPNEFIPERWLRGDDGKDEKGCPLKRDHPFVYLPFGFGPRNCVAKRIVDLEAEVYIMKLVRNFEISFDYPTDGFFRQHLNYTPAKPLKFKFIDTSK